MENNEEYTFDLDTIAPSQIAEIRQEGNYLKILTNTGVRFSQRIPQGKILEFDGSYRLRDIVIGS